ncbi:hypothetical protein PENARI_c007G11216 [Penicillium arizonense]|jgi:uncharacterized protein YkwD
MEVH